MTDTPADIAKLPFEAALAELEAIVEKLEKGAVALEESIKIYERGEALKAHCDKLLKNAEMRIEKITLGADGKPTLIQSRVIAGKILEARGPWKLSGNWWDLTRWETKEWDIALDNRGLYRIAQRATNANERRRMSANEGADNDRGRSLTFQDQWEVVGVYD